MDRRQDGGTDLREFISIFSKWKWFVLIPVFVSIVLVLFYFKVIPQSKFVEFNVDTDDILIIKNGIASKNFSMRELKELENIEGYSFTVVNRVQKNRDLLEERLIDFFKVSKKLLPDMNPQDIVRDFFKGVDEVYFVRFTRDLEIRVMNLRNNLFRKKTYREELNLKINMIDNFSRNKNILYITSDSMSSSFLPPGQQLNGYKISAGILNIEIELLKKSINLGSKLLAKLAETGTNSFREMLVLPDISLYKEQYVDQSFIAPRINVVEKKYLNKCKIKDHADLCIVFVILIPLTIMAFQLFLVFFLLSPKPSGKET